MKKNHFKNSNSVGAGVHKEGKIVFGPSLTLIFPIFGQREKLFNKPLSYYLETLKHDDESYYRDFCPIASCVKNHRKQKY